MSRAAATVVFEPGSGRGAGRRPVRRVPARPSPRGRRAAGAAGTRARRRGPRLRRRVRGHPAPQRPAGAHRRLVRPAGRGTGRRPRSSPRPSSPRPAGRPTSAGCATWATCSPRPPSPPTSTPELAGRALRIAESLSWRQLALARRRRPPRPRAAADGAARGRAARLDGVGRPRGRRRPAARRPARPAGRPPPGPAATLPRLRPADLRLTRRGVLVHRLLALDLLHEDAVTAAIAELHLPA